MHSQNKRNKNGKIGEVPLQGVKPEGLKFFWELVFLGPSAPLFKPYFVIKQ